MKKQTVIIIALGVLLLCCFVVIGMQIDQECDCAGVHSVGTSDTAHVKFRTDVRLDKPWEASWPKQDNGADLLVIQDHNTALNIAMQIFLVLPKDEYFESNVPWLVKYDPINKVYLVHFCVSDSEGHPDMHVAGGDIVIALDERTGQMLNYWIEG